MKVLALDIGSYSIKALYFEKKYRGHTIISFSTTLIKRDDKNVSYDQISIAIKELIKDNKYQPDQIITIYPAEKTTHRFITLPFRDAKRISITLPSELEEQLPFNLDDILYDWGIVESKGRNSRVLVTATRKHDYEGFKAMLADAGVSSSVVVPGADPLVHLMNFVKPGQEYVEVEKNGIKTKELKPYPVVLVDVGCSKTTVLVTKDGLPEYIRIINYGGDYITKKIMERYELSYEKAEQSKLEVGYIIMEGGTSVYTEEQLAFSNVLKEAVDVIIRDVNQTIAEYKADKKDTVQKVLLTGSGWKTRNFSEYMCQELKIPVEQVDYSKNLGVKLPFAGTPEESVFTVLVGFFTGYINKSEFKVLNIAKDIEQSADLGDVGDYYKIFKPTIRNIVVGLGVFLVYAMIHSFILNRVQARYKVELETKFKTAFPDKDKKAQLALLGNISKLSREVDNRMKVQRAVIEGEVSDKGDTALTVLRDLSSIIPKSQAVDILDLSIKGKSLKMQKVLVTSSEAAQLVRESIEKSGRFDSVKQGEIKQVQGGAREFELMATYKGGK